jgi:hypothetical protein
MSELDPKQYKHQRLRKALNKYKNNLKYMFTYQIGLKLEPNQEQNKEPDPKLQISNTTNKIDGGVFSPLKKLLNNHNGLSKDHRKNYIIEFLNSKGKKLT